MNLLLYREITPSAQISRLPDFGSAFREHMAAKRNPTAYRSSLAAWSLLAEGMNLLSLPPSEVRFEASGKPAFIDATLHFSLSHSAAYAAALISASPCGVDVECVRRDLSPQLLQRCMHPAEIAAGLDFFTVWTRKECIAKLTGTGMPSRPCLLNSIDSRCRWFEKRISDASQREYVLSAICQNGEAINLA